MKIKNGKSNGKTKSAAEQVLDFFIKWQRPATIREVALACFGKAPKGESWVRNSLRIPVREGVLVQVARGTYAPTWG